MNRVMDRPHRLAEVTDMQVKTNDNFLNPDCEIREFIKVIPYKQIKEIRYALYAIPEVKLITISKN